MGNKSITAIDSATAPTCQAWLLDGMEVTKLDAAISEYHPEMLFECCGPNNALQPVEKPHDTITGMLIQKYVQLELHLGKTYREYAFEIALEPDDRIHLDGLCLNVFCKIQKIRIAPIVVIYEAIDLRCAFWVCSEPFLEAQIGKPQDPRLSTAVECSGTHIDLRVAR